MLDTILQAERSDLAVLLAKRAESIVQPVASIHGDMDSLDEEVTFVVNEHANRIMLYADMFLQLEVCIDILVVLESRIGATF